MNVDEALRVADEAERSLIGVTEGPWTASLDLPPPVGDRDTTRLWHGSLYLCEFNSRWQSREQRTANCAFASASRTLVPQLASYVKALAARVRELEGNQ